MNLIQPHPDALCAPIVYSLDGMPEELYARHSFISQLLAQAFQEHQEPPCEVGDIVGPLPGLVLNDGAGSSFGEQAIGSRKVLGVALCLYTLKVPEEANSIELVGWTLILEGIPFAVRAVGFQRMML